MIYTCVVLMGMLFLWLAGYLKNTKIRFVRSLILTFIFYFMLYVLVSAGLFVFDIFMIKYAVLGTSAICVIFFCYKYWSVTQKKNSTIKEWVNECESYVSFALISFLVILTWGVFGFFGMGQDQGVYQTQAINFYYDLTETYQDIEEFNALEDSEYKEFYQEQIHSLRGYDLLIDSNFIPTVDVSDETGETEGIWHGIPTYSAILGLSAKVLGLKNMSYIGLFFYISLLCMLEFILVDLRIYRWIRLGAILLLGLSPQIVWIKESTLTEGFLSVLMIVFIYYILNQDKNKRFLSVIPIITFSFFHVTIFTMIPIFILIYVFRFVFEHEKIYLMCIRSVSVGYVLGFLMMIKVQPRYTLINYHYGLSFLSLEQIIVVVCIGSCFGLMISYIVPYIRIGEEAVEKIWKFMMRVIGVGTCVYLMFMVVANSTEWTQIRSMTLICYCVLTGIFIIPYIIYILITKKYEYSVELGIAGILFSWCVVIYAIIMKREISYYYYYSRYLAPFLSIIIVLFSILIKKKKLFYVFVLVGLLVLTPFTRVVIDKQDDTRIQWETFTAMLDELDTADTVILDTNLMEIFYFPIHAIGKAQVYPMYHTFEETMKYISAGEKVMLISKNKKENLNNWLSVKYRNDVERKMDYNFDYRNFILGLPKAEAVEPEVYQVTIYQLNGQSSDISVNEDNYLAGWQSTNPSGHRWMCARDAYLECYLKREDCQMIIHPGDIIPVSLIRADKVTVEVYLNEVFLGTIDWTEENARQDKIMHIPLEYINDGRNMVHFVSDLWSPAEYGADDQGTYGFSIKSIEFSDIASSYLSGWGTIDDSGYRWMCAQNAYLESYLRKEDYQMIIHLGHAIPFSSISEEKIVVDVYVNETFLGTIDWTEEDAGQDKSLDIPSEYIIDGRNTIHFVSDLWSPSEYGAEDKSTYSFSVESIEFKDAK